MKTKAKHRAIPSADRLNWLQKQITKAMADRITSIEDFQEYKQSRKSFARGGPNVAKTQKCFVCCGNATIRHHIKPLILGGTSKLNNIVPLCNDCHTEVHKVGPREFKKPAPDYSGGLRIQALLREMYSGEGNGFGVFSFLTYIV